MMISGLFTQIVLITLAGAIIFTYVEPTFRSIGQIQDDITVYKEEREKVQEVNERLNELLDRKSLVSADEQERLFTYLPDTVDPIIVQRDLLEIVEQSEVIFEDVSYDSPSSAQGGGGTAQNTAVTGVSAHTFTLSLSGTYEQVLQLLWLLERNKYPLEITSLELSPVEGGFIGASLTLTTYELADETPEESANDRNSET